MRARFAHLGWPLLIVLSALTLVLLVGEGAPPAVRLPVVLWFVTVCPGMAVARLIRLPDKASTWSLAVALSLCLATITAATMAYLEAWQPATGLYALVAAALVATSFEIVFGPPRYRTGEIDVR